MDGLGIRFRTDGPGKVYTWTRTYITVPPITKPEVRYDWGMDLRTLDPTLG